MKIVITTFAALCLSACTIKYSEFPSCTEFSLTRTCVENNQPRTIAVFFDGTSNTEVSRTNISKLHSIVTLRDKPYLHTLYVQGVGTDKKLSGNIFGNGLDARIKLAYHFIASRYRADKGDKIFLFGFSRGAYNARALAGMIYTAELPDFSSIQDEKAQRALVDEIFKYYKGRETLIAKREAIAGIPGYKQKAKNIRISFMGLFDTVSALSYQPREERKIADLSVEYVDQVCNVDKVAHAMSIDDNRGRAFSPVPMTVGEIVSTCKELNGLSEDAFYTKTSELINERVSEVWFAGAHADVGGGYSDNDALSGVPLNWMMRQIMRSETARHLLSKEPFVYEDIYASSHIGENALLGGLIYINKNRELAYYSDQMHPKGRPLTIHSSVIARRAIVPRTCREYDFSQQENSNIISEDSCYADGLTPNSIKGFGECFEKLPLEEGALRKNKMLADFILMFKCPEKGSRLIVDEPDMYR